MKLRDLSLKTRLLLAFSAVITVLSVAIGIGAFRLSQFNAGVRSLTDERLARLETANQWVVELLETARHTRNILIVDDKVKITQEIDAVRESQRQRKQHMEKLVSEVTEPEGKAVLQAAIDARNVYLPLENQYLEQVEAGHLVEGKATLLERARPAQLLFLDKLKKFSEYETNQVKVETGALNNAYHRSMTILALACLGGIAIALILALRITGAITRPLATAVGVLREIERGNFSSAITVSSNDETGQLLRALNTMQGNLKERTDRERAIANETSRIKSALDRASASVMLADENFNIIYSNEAAQLLFSANQAEFRRDLPNFDAARIIGSNIDIFHKNPAHQRRMLAGLQSTHQAEIRLGGRALRIAASPVLGSDGKRTGTVVEWWDRTQEVRGEEEVSAIVQAALDGDLSKQIALEGKTGFYATLARNLNQLLQNMSQIIERIQAATREVLSGANEISQGNANLSQRTEEQSASLEETASSMEEMTTTVRQNADNAGQANQLAMASRDQAEKGGSVVAKAVSAMTDINNASKKIADIIGVIDDIAFQTNLLALNAAVEAARAGEQGRGFAVVASEVRNLAGRSATAAKEIKELIQDSVVKIGDGSKLVTHSGEMLEHIVASVKKVSDIVGEIAAASREQSSGIEQVNRAITQMDEATQQNAALVEQASAASRLMADQARELSETISKYRTNGSAQPNTARLPVGSGHATSSSTGSTVLPRLERRTAKRPWSGVKGAAHSVKAAPSAQAVSTVETSSAAASDYQEF